MSRLKTLMENEQTQQFLTEHQDLIMEGGEQTARFNEILKEFVIQHPDVFVEDTLEDTYKNIRIFSEIATSQYIAEMVNIYGDEVQQVEESTSDPLSDYL